MIMHEENYGITATIIAMVEGMFFEVDQGLDARNKFTDSMEATGLCDWCFSEGGMYEWTVGFHDIKDVKEFEAVICNYLKELGVTKFTIQIRDAESIKGKRI